MGDWLDLPPTAIAGRWADASPRRALGMSTTLGARTWSRQQKFRVVLGPLDRGQFQRMLPGGASLPKLDSDLVRSYVGRRAAAGMCA